MIHVAHFLNVNSENELEEVLTFYTTTKNKSSTIFLGTRVRSVKKELCEVNVSGNGESSKSESLSCFVFHHIPVSVGSVDVFLFYHPSAVNGSRLEV